MPTMKQDTIWLTIFPNHSIIKPLNKRIVLSNNSWFLHFYVDICRRYNYLCKNPTLVYLYIIFRTRVMWFGRSSAVQGVAKSQTRLSDWNEQNWTELNLSTWEDTWDYEQLHFCLQSHNLPIKNEVNSLHTLYNNFVFKKGRWILLYREKWGS